MTISNKGNEGIDGNPGDLLVVFIEENHSYFVRDGENVIIEANITYPTAVLGGKIEIPTLDGKADLKIPAGIQSNQILRMKRKGFPVLRGGHIGDQLVKIQIQTPTNFSRQTKKIIEDLNKSLSDIKRPYSKIEL
jgi:molecular chaperone DnaJ